MSKNRSSYITTKELFNILHKRNFSDLHIISWEINDFLLYTGIIRFVVLDKFSRQVIRNSYNEKANLEISEEKFNPFKSFD